MKTPTQIAEQIVGELSFSSNRMLDGRLVGEQYFAAEAIKAAIETERAAQENLRSALCDAAIALNGVTTSRLQPRGRVALAARKKAMTVLTGL